MGDIPTLFVARISLITIHRKCTIWRCGCFECQMIWWYAGYGQKWFLATGHCCKWVFIALQKWPHYAKQQLCKTKQKSQFRLMLSFIRRYKRCWNLFNYWGKSLHFSSRL